MKTLILVTLSLLVSSMSYAQQEGQAHRTSQVVAAFLQQAQKADTPIAKKLEEARAEIGNGYCSEACTIPQNLRASDLQVLVTSSEVYIGQNYAGEEVPRERDPGYEQWTMQVHVPAKSVYYGGRITGYENVTFQCTLVTTEYKAKKVKIQCAPKAP